MRHCEWPKCEREAAEKVAMGGYTYLLCLKCAPWVKAVLANNKPAIRRRANDKVCPDCGARGERKGHMTCMYPKE